MQFHQKGHKGSDGFLCGALDWTHAGRRSGSWPFPGLECRKSGRTLRPHVARRTEAEPGMDVICERTAGGLRSEI